MEPVKLSKTDAARALVRHHFATKRSISEVLDELHCVQYDPIAPVGCNHDIVFQARLPDFKVGEWQKTAYVDRLIYDGWDKQACLIPMKEWPLHRVFYSVQQSWFQKKIFEDHKDAVDAILSEIAARGPLMPKEFDFQLRRQDWVGHWYGPSVTKQTLRALWHSGLVMTSGRKKGQHLYDLAERIVPPHLYNCPRIPDDEAVRELIGQRHHCMGIVRPGAPSEVWSNQVLHPGKKKSLDVLVAEQRIVPVDVEGMKANASPDLLSMLDQPCLEPRVVFVAPLDPFLWDRKMTAHIFGFDYSWEIYTPEAKRRWGYYVLPVLFGDALVARVEFWARDGVLEIRRWHWEGSGAPAGFLDALKPALRKFMAYCSAERIEVGESMDAKVRRVAAKA